MMKSSASLPWLLLLLPALLRGGEIILAGSAYGRHETRLLVNQIAVSEEKVWRHSLAGDDIPLDRLPECSLLVVASSVQTPLAPGQMQRLQEWVGNGGNLLLIAQAARSLAPAEQWRWAGFSQFRVISKGYPVTVVDPASPLLAGLALPTGELFSGTAAFVPEPALQVALGGPGNCMAGWTRVGRGQVFLLAQEYFRLVGRENPFAPHWRHMLKNIFALATPVSDSDLRQQQLRAWQQKRHGGVLVWDREWQRGEVHGPRFDPPLPQESELFTRGELHLARREFESVQINLTPLESFRSVSWSLDHGGFPEGKIEVLVQAAPPPIAWPRAPELAREFPYWLIPPQYLPPEGKPEWTPAAVGETQIVWLRFNTHGVAAGRYQPVLKLAFDNATRLELPFAVTVAKSAVPTRRPILLGVGGYALDAMSLDRNHRFLDNLRDHGNEWALINVVRLETVKLTDTGEALTAAVLKRLGAGDAATPLPLLDFTALNPWIHACLERHLTHFRINPSLAQLTATARKAGVPETLLPRLEAWYGRELSGYLHGKGIRMLLLSKGDELHRDKLYAEWLPWARSMTALGFDCTSTFSFGHGDPRQLISDLSPYVRLWTLNRGLAPAFLELRQKGDIAIRPDALVGTYGAGEGRGSEFRKPLSASRFLGWEAWRLGLQNCSPNPWFKSWLYYCDYGTRGEAGGLGGERWVSYVDYANPDVPPADCPFWEGIRDGMEEGNLAAWLQARAGKHDRQDLLDRLNALLADQPDAPIRGRREMRQSGGQEVPVYNVSADCTGYRQAKSAVLDMLDELPPDPALFWHQIDLAKLQLTGSPAAVNQFSQLVSERFGLTLALDPRPPVVIHFQIDAAVRPGDYRISENRIEGSPCLLTVSGGDEPGLHLGVRLFAAFLSQHGR